MTCESGESRRAPVPSDDGMAWAKSAADRVARRFGVGDRATLDQFRSEQGQRSLYLFDVRDPLEYVAGHVAGAVLAPGGQLVQATDYYVGTLGARAEAVSVIGVGEQTRQMTCSAEVAVVGGCIQNSNSRSMVAYVRKQAGQAKYVMAVRSARSGTVRRNSFRDATEFHR